MTDVILNQILDIGDSDLTLDSSKTRIIDYQALMSFEEKRGSQDLVYWTKYIGKHGSKHLIGNHAELGIIETYDLDINLFCLVNLVLFIRLTYKWFKYNLCKR